MELIGPEFIDNARADANVEDGRTEACRQLDLIYERTMQSGPYSPELERAASILSAAAMRVETLPPSVNEVAQAKELFGNRKVVFYTLNLLEDSQHKQPDLHIVK